jgi:hypothetical protein
MLRVQCTQCGGRVRAGDDWAGRTGNCPNCQAEISFPDAAPLGWELPPGWEYPRVPRGTVKTEPKYLPLVESVLGNVACLSLGLLGCWLLYVSITAISTGVLKKAGNRAPTLQVQDPAWFWLESGGKLAFGSFLVLLFVLFIAGWIKRGVAGVPRQFTLRELLVSFTIAAVALGLAIVVIKFLLATVHQPINLVYFVCIATVGLMFLGNGWVEQKKGCLEPHAHNRDYVLRDYHPWRFWFGIAARYLFGGAMLVLSVVLLVGAFLK